MVAESKEVYKEMTIEERVDELANLYNQLNVSVRETVMQIIEIAKEAANGLENHENRIKELEDKLGE